MSKKIKVDLDKILERMENKEVDSKEIIDYFRLKVNKKYLYDNI